ncbi:murein L,D-transpeptidase [Cesiribacter andamanensis AMV16]|uniref:Murein L,D-transpeptidase n=2 Tax=Cesiribacter TaxID=1133570 RepID=M7MZG7_9BACT|nr:murein L,D-transpeptidase [Cesiribacter andamanensis AMV16]
MSIVLLLALALCTAACESGTGASRGMFAGLFGSRFDVDELNVALAEELSDSTRMLQNLKDLELNDDQQEHFKKFYRQRDYQTAWVTSRGLNKQGEALLEAIDKAGDDGLNSEDYKLQYLQHSKKRVEKEKEVALEEVTKLDKELTAAYLKLASHKLKGRVNPERLDALWKTNRRSKDLARHLQNALDRGSIAESLQELEPQDPQYTALKKAYNNYRQLLEEKGEWPQLPADLTIKAGDSSKYVATLRERLSADGYFKTPAPDSLQQVYDSTLVQAVMTYQDINGLEPDGVVGGETLAMLNTPLKERINQLQLNLERIRWSPEKPEGKYLLVNVPQYKLYIFNGNKKDMEMRVIVGEAYKSNTPIFNDTLQYIAFSPTWTVPNSIATQEMLPKLQKDPSWLSRNNFVLYEGWSENAPELNPRSINWNKVSADNFPYRIVQQPGKSNALGHMKFMFPNDMDIYLHDTPTESLFQRAERDFSHGCVRVEKPIDLAVYLLQDEGWDAAKVQEHMNLPTPENVVLEEKLPIFIDYRTAWVDDEGHVTFAKDIYGHDKKQMNRFEELLATN